MTGKELRTERELRGISQGEVAVAAKVTRVTVWQWETLEAVPPEVEARYKQAVLDADTARARRVTGGDGA
jgi:transcriptional regulator with XRE-family HTH domain